MIRTTDVLYECKKCGVLVRDPKYKCPNCGNKDDGDKHVLKDGGGVTTVKRNWYNTVRLTQ